VILFFSDGRLGNQIFQYAFLNKLSKENELILCFNMKIFCELFDINNKLFFQSSNKCIIIFFKKILVPYFFTPLIKYKLISYVEQKKDEDFNPLPTLIKKRGFFSFITFVNTDFFQSEKFFKRNIVGKIQMKQKYISIASDFLSIIPIGYIKIFIHVRRGDYLNIIFKGCHGIELPFEYFEKGIIILKSQIEKPFFIFISDDTAYVEKLFQHVEPKIISKNSMEVDFAIMTLCDAAIISNSSFSWWGAYLIKNRKVVISPKYWYGWKKKVESHIGIQPKNSKILDF
jgi:Glycosyl transferase family 11